MHLLSPLEIPVIGYSKHSMQASDMIVQENFFSVQTSVLEKTVAPTGNFGQRLNNYKGYTASVCTTYILTMRKCPNHEYHKQNQRS